MDDALVLAHGALHGPWCWEPTLLQLEKHDVRCSAVDLNRGGLHADRAAVQEAVDELRKEGYRVHAIGHSLGCSSVALLDPATIATAIFLAGPVEGPGMPSATDCTFPEFLSCLKTQSDGRVLLEREDARNLFYHRCSRDEAEAALDRLRPTFVYGGEVPATPLWKAIPVTYVECTDDRSVRREYQRSAAAQCPHSAQIDSDHSPMLGQPKELAQIILTAMQRVN